MTAGISSSTATTKFTPGITWTSPSSLAPTTTYTPACTTPTCSPSSMPALPFQLHPQLQASQKNRILDTCADAIGEDFHTTLKAYWKCQGDVESYPIYAAFNQINIKRERVTLLIWRLVSGRLRGMPEVLPMWHTVSTR